MTYERHIGNLIAIRNNYPPGDHPTFDAAIALMRAAEPKDAAAEREHCSKKAREFGYSEAWIEVRATELMLERAAARAESAARIAELEAELLTAQNNECKCWGMT